MRYTRGRGVEGGGRSARASPCGERGKEGAKPQCYLMLYEARKY